MSTGVMQPYTADDFRMSLVMQHVPLSVVIVFDPHCHSPLVYVGGPFSYGWFNTALMVEGKGYLPWLMDW